MPTLGCESRNSDSRIIKTGILTCDKTEYTGFYVCHVCKKNSSQLLERQKVFSI